MPNFSREHMRYIRILAWILVVGIVVLSVVPAYERPDSGVEHNFEHLLAFGFVGLVFAFAYSWQLMVLLLSGILFALLLELAQIPLPTRHARIEDFLVDAFGASLGITLALLARSACKSPIVRRWTASSANRISRH
jgi:VanZ family protein